MGHISIRVSTLRGDQKIDFDVFVKINDKMVHYLRRGDSFEGLRLKRLKEKKLKNLYILVDAEPSYRTYLKTNMESAYDPKSKRDFQARADVVHGDQESHVEAVFESPEDRSAYDETKEASLRYLDFLLKNPQAIPVVLKIENVDKSLAHHGISVATMAFGLSQKMQPMDPKMVQWLVFGSLLHDIGHHGSKVNFSQPLSLLSPADLTLYKGHPKMGLERLKQTMHFDSQVLRIINEHEEHLDSTGFPGGLHENKLDPLSIITATCNAMDRLISFEGISKSEAPKKLIMEHVGEHPLDQIKLLSEIIKAL